MAILFFDTETNGKVDFKLPATHPTQPRVVQLAAMLTTNDGREVARLHTLIFPDGWGIPDEAKAIHGIAYDDCANHGVPIMPALLTLNGMASAAQVIVGHNVQFDDMILTGECQRLNAGVEFAPGRDRYCTMQRSTAICKLPGNYGKYKWPKLAEAHQILCGKPLEGAHDAMADVLGCAAVYFALRDKTYERI